MNVPESMISINLFMVCHLLCRILRAIDFLIAADYQVYSYDNYDGAHDLLQSDLLTEYDEAPDEAPDGGSCLVSIGSDKWQVLKHLLPSDSIES